MPHQTLKLIPGVDQNRTTTFNEAAISQTNLIRFVPDRQGVALVQKLGGWTKFFANSVGDIVRALWAWEDTNANTYLGLGQQSTSVNGNGLSVIFSGNRQVITPRTDTLNYAFSASNGITTSAGSSTVTIYAVGSNVSAYDTVYITTQIAVDGLVLFGTYPCLFLGTDQFRIVAKDALGNPLAATSTITSPSGAVPYFTFSINQAQVSVVLNNHGYSVGSTFPIVVSLTYAGVTLYGNYTVNSVTDANTFTFIAGSSATSSGSTYLNSGQAQYLFYRTPAPLPTSIGYGVGGYGAGGYGTGVLPPSTVQGSPINVSDWTLDNWGQIFVSCPVGGGIYTWQPNTGAVVASVIANAPIVNDGMFVAMPQRQVVAWGSTFTGIQDPLLINWSDVNDYTSWIPKITNQAGSYRLPRGSRIVGCIQGPQQGLVWTDLAIWAMQYSGPPYVYQFNEIGTGCGLISRKAATSMNGVVYWMGQSQFFKLGNNGVEIIRCPIWDVIFQDLDLNNVDKIRIAANSQFGEISWYYPTTTDGGEVSKYVKYNVTLDQWDFGTLTRTAWINQSVLGPPIGAGISSPNYYVYQHETSPDADGTVMQSFFQTGYFAMSDAEVKVFVDQVWPDMKWGYYGQSQTAHVELSFYTADYPTDTPKVYGPYDLSTATTYITPRFRARLMSLRIDSSPTEIGTFWRLGAIRYRYEQDGKF